MNRLVSGIVYGSILWVQLSACLAQDSFELQVSNDLISLDASNAELRLVLEDLATEIGFKLWISNGLEAPPVNLQIENLSLDETLKRLLADNNHALVYDDDAMVTGLYVLPPGTAQIENVEPAVPDIDDIRLMVLKNALASSTIPDNIKTALMKQFNGIHDADTESLAAKPDQAMYRVIEVLEKIGSANPETLEQIRRNIDLDTVLQRE